MQPLADNLVTILVHRGSDEFTSVKSHAAQSAYAYSLQGLWRINIALNFGSTYMIPSSTMVLMSNFIVNSKSPWGLWKSQPMPGAYVTSPTTLWGS